MERDATALEADLERRLDFSEHPLDEAHRAITALTDYGLLCIDQALNRGRGRSFAFSITERSPR